MKSKCYLFLCFIALFSLSCHQDESLFEELNNKVLLKSVLIEGEVLYEYTYNKAGLVEEEKSKYSYTKYIYNSKNQLVRANHYWDTRMFSSNSHVLHDLEKRKEWVSPENTDLYSYNKFEYFKDGRLKRQNTKRLTSDSQSLSEYEYNEAGYQSKRKFFDQSGRLSGYDAFYYDERGNLIKKERHNVNEDGSQYLSTTNEYEFDKHSNPYISFRGLMRPGPYSNANNIIKETYTLHFEVDSFVENPQITNNAYSYNEEGYPVLKNGNWKYIYYE